MRDDRYDALRALQQCVREDQRVLGSCMASEILFRYSRYHATPTLTCRRTSKSCGKTSYCECGCHQVSALAHEFRRACESKRAESRLHERLEEARAPGADLVVRFPLVRLPEHVLVCLDLRCEANSSSAAGQRIRRPRIEHRRAGMARFDRLFDGCTRLSTDSCTARWQNSERHRLCVMRTSLGRMHNEPHYVGP